MSAISKSDVVEYAKVYNFIWYTPRNTPDFDELVELIYQDVKKLPYETLKRNADGGDYDSILQLAMRSYTGCGVPEGTYGPAYLMKKIPNEPTVPRPIRARVFSYLAFVCWDRRESTPGTLNVANVYRGAMCANAASALGYACNIVLLTSIFAHDCGFDHPATSTWENRDALAQYSFDGFTDLWRVKAEMDRVRDLGLADDDEARDEFAARFGPDAYVCATVDCWIEATPSAPLFRCTGRCIPHLKPLYCCVEHQKDDWRKHRLLCKW